MSDPDNKPDTTAQPNVTIDQSGSPPTEGKPAGSFSQEDVNRIVATRLQEDRARRPAQAPAPKPAPSNDAKTSDGDVRAELLEMKQRLAFEKRTSKFDLDDAKSSALFKVYQANPDGFEEAVTVFGLKPTQQQSATQNGSTVDPAKTGAAAPTAPSGPVNPMTSGGGMLDIFNLSTEQLDQLGPQGLRGEYEKILAVGAQRAGAPPVHRALQRK
jgi:hypothetical protein